MYYLRSKAASEPIKFTLSEKHQRKYAGGKGAALETESVESETEETAIPVQSQTAPAMTMTATTVQDLPEGAVCTMEEGCLMCGS
jgi:hypothetical protein